MPGDSIKNGKVQAKTTFTFGARLKIQVLQALFVFAALAVGVCAQADVIDDFETNGGNNNLPNGWTNSGCSNNNGRWEGSAQTAGGLRLGPHGGSRQATTDSGTSFVTVGNTCVAESPAYTVADPTALSVYFYFGTTTQQNGCNNDQFVLQYRTSTDGGSNYTSYANFSPDVNVSSDAAQTPAWTQATQALGATVNRVQIRVSVTNGSDPGPGCNNADNTVEAGLDDLLITETPPSPALSIAKIITANADADGNGFITLGDVLTYQVTATALNATHTNVVVSDPALSPNSATCPSVAANSTCVLTGTYTVTATDVAVGSISNTATADSNEAALVTTTLVSTVFTGIRDIYYLPAPEDELLTTMQTISPGSCGNTVPASPVQSYSSISVLRENTYIFFDHHEDGYEADITDPLQSTTEIWGDGNPGNGSPPGVPSDILVQGSVILLNNAVTTSTINSVIDFDGGDKIATTAPIAVTKTNWATGTGTLFAGALEVYPVVNWGLHYEMPVGENLTSGNFQLYQYSGALIMASEDGTSVEVDADGNGVLDVPAFNLNEGQTYHVNGGIQPGGTITATKAIQVALITGDVCANYESRYLTLFPSDDWDNDYYNPVGTRSADPTTVVLYNPNASAMDVLVEQSGGVFTTVNVPAGGTNRFEMTNNSGAHLCAKGTGNTCDPNGPVFYPVANIDGDDTNGGSGQAYDWGFTLIPSTSISQQILVGLGFGQDPNATFSENTAPVWITTDFLSDAIPNTDTLRICIDYDNDGTDSGPALVDPVTGREYDTQLDLTPLTSSRLYDPDNDQTGMFVWVCDPVASHQQNGIIVAAWGQDPNTASTGAPAVDMGTGIPNMPAIRVNKFGSVSGDTNGDGFPNVGDTISYEVEFINVGFVPMGINAMLLQDILPSYVDYVPNTSEINYGTGGGFVTLADAGTTPFPLDESGHPVPQAVAIEQKITVTYDVLVTGLPAADDFICNDAAGSYGPENRRDDNCLTPSSQNFDLGDAPNSYGTALPGGAVHAVVNSTLYLGTIPDTEDDGQSGAQADGDGGDEDGVTFTSDGYGGGAVVEITATATGRNSTGAPAMLCGYLDGGGNGTINGAFNRSVTYAANNVGIASPTVGAGNEELCIRVPASGSTSVTLAGGSNPAQASCTNTAGNFTCSLTWQPNYVSNVTTYARFRLTSDPQFFSTSSPSPTGLALDGEVEDYRLDIVPTAAIIGDVALAAMGVDAFLADIGVADMNADALFNLLKSWAPSRAAGMSSASVDQILVALMDYLDPDRDNRVAVLRWDTLEERGTIGFYVERQGEGGRSIRINNDMLPGMITAPMGAEYILADPGAQPGHRYEYLLIELEATGSTRNYGPYSVELP